MSECADNCTREQCQVCQRCVRFIVGETVELSPEGILVLGRRMLQRGTVTGFDKNKQKLIIVMVQWHSVPDGMIGRVKPNYLQKSFSEDRPFI